MTTLRFHIRFLSPFRVSTGYAAGGATEIVDRDDPLPGTSLKGVMRATAAALLGADCPVLGEVFGSAKLPCPWQWTSATPTAGSSWTDPVTAARVQIDPASHTAVDGMLALAEETITGSAEFQIRQQGRIDPGRLGTHQQVLAVAARATKSLGAERRRGLGWVSITCPDIGLDQAAVIEFLKLRQS